MGYVHKICNHGALQFVPEDELPDMTIVKWS